MTEKSPSQDKRGEKFNKVIDDVLNQILGREATHIIYEYLENNHGIERHEIAQKLDSFNHALEQYLGSGAVVIEKVIRENLELIGLEENKGFDFSEQSKILKLA